MRLEVESLSKLREAFKGLNLSRTIETALLKYMDEGAGTLEEKPKHKSTSVSLDVTTAQRLDEFSAKTGVSITAVIRLAIEWGIKDLGGKADKKAEQA